MEGIIVVTIIVLFMNLWFYLKFLVGVIQFLLNKNKENSEPTRQDAINAVTCLTILVLLDTILITSWIFRLIK